MKICNFVRRHQSDTRTEDRKKRGNRIVWLFSATAIIVLFFSVSAFLMQLFIPQALAAQDKHTSFSQTCAADASSQLLVNVSNNSSSDQLDAGENPYFSTYSARSVVPGSSNGSVNYISAAQTCSASVQQMRRVFSSASTVVIAPASARVEVLCAASLAGAYKAPLLFTNLDGSIDEECISYLSELGCTHVVLVGSDKHNVQATLDILSFLTNRSSDMSNEIQSSIQDLDLSFYDTLSQPIQVDYVRGTTEADCSLAALSFGSERELWKSKEVLVVNSDENTKYNICASYVYTQAEPVFIAEADGRLSSHLKFLFEASVLDCLDSVSTIQVLGHKGSAQDLFARTLLLNFREKNGAALISYVNEQGTRSASSADENNAINSSIDWNNSVIVNQDQASSATAGIMASCLGGVALSTSAHNFSSNFQALINSGTTNLVLSGEGGVVDAPTLSALRARMGIYEVSIFTSPIKLDEMANQEVDLYMEDGYATKSKDEILEAMDPGNASRGSETYYIFAVLGKGYSGATSAEQLNSFIDSIAPQYEAAYGCTSILRGTGQHFIDAAKEYGVNEIYLLCHAIHESACGCSQLAQGQHNGSKNLYGIAAFDSNPNNGANYASEQGWNNVEESIRGGAAWISSNYITRSSNGITQNTLYFMRWNIGSVQHQYATGLSWANSIAKMMNRFYSYSGISLEHTGLDFCVVDYPQ